MQQRVLLPSLKPVYFFYSSCMNLEISPVMHLASGMQYAWLYLLQKFIRKTHFLSI